MCIRDRLMILLVTVIVLYRTMRPLYALLRWLDGYTVGARNAPLAVETSVTEFRKLNDAARRYAERAESSFERQKQFIGNASHEMQTPLAVCRNRLEMLVDDAHALTGEQLGEIAKVQRTLDYLVRLNRSLLLLSKIDNGQFPEAEEVDVNALVRRTAEDLSLIHIYGHFREGRFVVRQRVGLLEQGPHADREDGRLQQQIVVSHPIEKEGTSDGFLFSLYRLPGRSGAYFFESTRISTEAPDHWLISRFSVRRRRPA